MKTSELVPGTEKKQRKPYAAMISDERAIWNHRAAEVMEKLGGGFASALARAYFRADADNQLRILSAFGELFEKYREWARDEWEQKETPED